jgi:hypothetical protein
MKNESNKQTAVDWLVEKLQESGLSLMTDEFKIIQQAKAMHEEEIIKAVKYGFNKEYFTPNFLDQQELFYQYYEQTYGGNK